MKKIQVVLLIATGVLILAPAVSWSVPSKWSKAQIEKIQESIQTSKNMSDKSYELVGNAHQNSTVASSNFDNTRVAGFRQASDAFSEAERKFLQARKTFDDAWIQTQNGLERSDLNSVKNGINLHNAGTQIYYRAWSNSRRPTLRSNLPLITTRYHTLKVKSALPHSVRIKPSNKHLQDRLPT
jgi:hypothetical protein